ncbi:hypothetical protein ACNO8S_13650 [Haloarcula sp. KBTZ06]|uniref:hypothetical protein n=1 Tax=Haloarcula sp. KBTZ06 TaxID=3402682 RepID=UPI003B4322AC
MTPPDQYDVFEKGARQTRVNWKNQLKQIEDSYREHRGVVHGVQKDGIQNAWDARNTDREDEWKIQFKLVRGEDQTFFVIEDSGTIGLTGPVRDGADYESELEEHDRWARFESLAFTKDDSSDALGSRGQGKFIFVAASKDNVIVYDSLREDGSYRTGYRRVKRTESPVNSWDNAEGREKFAELTDHELEELDHVGTRVVIVEPSNELTSAVESGEFEDYVAETWWELLKFHDATITISDDDSTTTVSPPVEFDLPTEADGSRDVWLVEDEQIEDKYGVAKMHLVHDPDQNIPRVYRGIALQRGGMKVESIEPRRRVPPDIADHLYGFITFDAATEEELKRAENPEHYGFSGRYQVTKIINSYVKDQIELFAREELDWTWSEEVESERQQQAAEQRALNSVNEAFSDFDFHTGDTAGTDSTSTSTSPGRKKDVRLSMPEPNFPRSDHRVEYGDEIKRIRVNALNSLDYEIEAQLRIDLEFRNQSLSEFTQQITVPASAGSDPGTYESDPYRQPIEEGDFPIPGKYSLTAQLAALEDSPNFSRGEIIDTVSLTVYLEVEPPAGDGPFADCTPAKLDDDTVYGEVVRTEKGQRQARVYQYNINHPEYKAVKTDTDASADYLFRLMSQALLLDELERGNQDIFQNADLDSPEGALQAMVDEMGDLSAAYYTT